MPLTRPLLTLPNTAFTQCGVKEKVTSISIYDTRRVEILTKQGRKDLIQPHDLSWPQFSSIGDFVAYLKACHFQLRQFNNGEYKLISLVKGLGGGNGLTIPIDIEEEESIFIDESSLRPESSHPHSLSIPIYYGPADDKGYTSIARAPGDDYIPPILDMTASAKTGQESEILDATESPTPGQSIAPPEYQDQASQQTFIPINKLLDPEEQVPIKADTLTESFETLAETLPFSDNAHPVNDEHTESDFTPHIATLGITSQANINWLIGDLSSLAQSTINSFPTDSEETSSYLCLSELVKLSPTEYRQSVENNGSEEEKITAILQKIDALEHSIAEAKQKSEKHQAAIDELKIQQDEFNRITASLQEKQAFKASVHAFLEKHAERPQVQAFYDSFLTNLSASLLALFLLRNSQKLVKAESGTILDITKQGKNSYGGLFSGVESGIDLTKSAVGFIPTIVEKLPKLIPQAAKFLKAISAGVPFISGVATVLKVGVTHGIKMHEEKQLANTDDLMLGLTPKGLEKIAYYLAFGVTRTYVQQINLLTEEGATTFAVCGVRRILIGLLNGETQHEKYGFDAAVITILRLSSVSQNPIKLFGIPIPWTHAKLKAHGDLEVTENELYKYCGVLYRDANQNEQRYINTIKEKERSQTLKFMEVSIEAFNIIKHMLTPTVTARIDEHARELPALPLDPLPQNGTFAISSSSDSPSRQEFDALQQRLETMEKELVKEKKKSASFGKVIMALAQHTLGKEGFDELLKQILKPEPTKTTQQTPKTSIQSIKSATVPWTDTYQAKATAGGGDCALHAAFGTVEDGKYTCDNITQRRREIAQKIQAIEDKTDPLLPSVLVALKELMYNKLDIEERFINIDQTQYPLIAIRRDSYHIDDGLEDLDLEHADFDLQTIKPILTQYATFIGKQGRWLLPCELSIIAYVFDVTIAYYNNIQTKSMPYEIYNPDSSNRSTPVRVCFNGINHYERMEEIATASK